MLISLPVYSSVHTCSCPLETQLVLQICLIPCDQATANPFASSQLPDTRLYLLPLHSRQILSTETGLHLPPRLSHGVHDNIQLFVLPLAHMPPVRLRAIRHLHSAHKEDLPRQSSVAEPGQAERRAAGRDEGDDEEH